MAKNKKVHTTAPEKQKQVNYPVRTSEECKECSDQCKEGLNYIRSIMPGKRYNGVVCKGGVLI